MKNNIGLVPLRNFAILESKEGLYRSAQPLYDYEYDWMKKVLNIKTIVNLREESSHDTDFATKHGINVINFLVKDHHTPNENQVNEFIKLIQDKENYPLLFHCAHGQGRTSTFCVIARIASGWTLEEAIKEEQELFHYGFKHPAQLNFLNSFFKS